MSAPAPDRPAPDSPHAANPPPGIESSLKIADICRAAHCSRRALERERSAGRLPKPDHFIGRSPRWRPATILRWLGEKSDGRGAR